MKLRNKIVALFLTVACAFGLAVAGNATKVNAAEETFTLVKNVADLAVGDSVIVVASKSNVALSTEQKSNNRGQTAISKDGENITIDNTGNVQILTLQAGKLDGTFAFYTGKGYLYAASSSSNYLRTETTLSNNSSWVITVTSAGVATIKAKGTNTRNWMRYNSQSSLFACYSSGQNDISLYKLAANVEELTDAEKLAVAKDSLNLDSNIITSNISLPTIGAYGAEISWESSNDGILDFEGYVERPEEDTEVTLTATITLGDLVETKVFEVVVKGGRAVVTNPVAGTPYKLMLTQETLSKDLFFTGVVSGNYISSTEDAAKAAILTLIEVEGGYHLQALVNGEVKYINGVVSGKHVNAKAQDTPTTVWQYNTTYNTLVSKFTTTEETNTDFYIGTFNNYDTFSMSKISFAATSFVSHFVKLTAAELEEYNALKVKVGYQVGTKDEAKALRLVAEFNLTAEKLETFESTIAFRVTHNDVTDERVVTTLYSSVNPMNDEAELTGAYYAVLTYVNIPAGEYLVEVLVDGEVAATVTATVA